MVYHTNHCTCHKSNWNSKRFNGGAMVYFEEIIDNDFCDENEITIEDFDHQRLTYEKKFFDSEGLERLVELERKACADEGLHFSEKEYRESRASNFWIETRGLNQEVIDWLEDNIDDRKFVDPNSPIEKRKAWAFGDDKYNSNTPWEFKLFFARQKDALKFIKEWSIYKKPTFYFDYFHSDRRELDINELISINNAYRRGNGLVEVDIGDVINANHDTSTNLSEDSFDFIDWEAELEA